jgi:hypothetical protein
VRGIEKHGIGQRLFFEFESILAAPNVPESVHCSVLCPAGIHPNKIIHAVLEVPTAASTPSNLQSDNGLPKTL